MYVAMYVGIWKKIIERRYYCTTNRLFFLWACVHLSGNSNNRTTARRPGTTLAKVLKQINRLGGMALNMQLAMATNVRYPPVLGEQGCSKQGRISNVNNVKHLTVKEKIHASNSLKRELAQLHTLRDIGI